MRRSLGFRFCIGVTGLVLIAMVAAAISRELRLLETSTVGPPYPLPVYSLMPAPGTSPIAGSPGAAGADFSQVYTSALALRHGQSAYKPTSPEFRDRWGRPPGYPPLMNWLYVPLSLLPYWKALVTHCFLSLAALFGATFLVLREAQLSRYFGQVVVAQASLYFLTPVGLTNLERGQFDLFVATVGALSLACLFSRRHRFDLAALGGAMAALKWTAVPFVGGFSSAAFLLSSHPRRWVFAVLPVVTVALTLGFWHSLSEYWVTIKTFELDAAPTAMSLQHILPRTWTKLTPVIVALVVTTLAFVRGDSASDRSQLLQSVSGPFAITLMALAASLNTIAYEYHSVSMLGTVPGLIVWAERGPGVSGTVKAVTCVAFALFLVVAFRVFGSADLFSIAPADQLEASGMAHVYAAGSLFFFGVCIYVLVKSPRVIVDHA